MKKKVKTKPPVIFAITKLDGQLYGLFDKGQMVRITPDGNRVPRIRVSKKERLRLRKRLHEVNRMDSRELAGRIVKNAVAASAVNPKPDEQLMAELETIG
jgi:hypothetical protein